MDRTQIGNARQQDDNRIAVRDARPLGECWQELLAKFAEFDLSTADYQPAQMEMYRAMRPDPDSAKTQAWIKACIMADKATDTLRAAFNLGKLPLWRIHNAREVPVAPAVIERANVKYGIFKSHERPEPDMQGARLWVKLSDWEAFLERTVIPDPAKSKEPPEGPFITLSEALTWIAFGVSMDCSLLDAVLLLDRYGDLAPQEAIENAVTRLTVKADSGKIAMRGKYRERPGDEKRGLLTEPIEPVRFADFRQFYHPHDALCHGEGLAYWRTGPANVERRRNGGRLDSYVAVSVNRSELLREFPPKKTASESPGGKPEGRRRPGPAPDPDWPEAIAKVTHDCIAAGYTRPLKRGSKAAIQTMLLSFMADKDKHYSDDTAAKYANEVIAALPDR